MEWSPGTRAGEYKLIERLGKGGMAETWRAELRAAEGVRRVVVLKRVLPSFADNAQFVEAFIEEARLTAQLSHGNVAQIFDFGQLADGSHFIAMEWVDGTSLDRVFKRGVSRGYWHMPYPIAGLIALEVAKGLEHVHTRRGRDGPLDIVHRDISPDNILVGVSGETKIIDFGIAKSMQEGRNQTEAGIVKGKAIYFSPEQAQGEEVDFKTDLYALGVVLYRLCTGKKAFDGVGLKVMQAIAAGRYVPVLKANPAVPESLALIIETAMARDKRERFGSTLEMVEALQACVRALAPRAGPHWVAAWMHFLYADELKKRGDTEEPSTGFVELIASWKPKARNTQEIDQGAVEHAHGLPSADVPGSRPSSQLPGEALSLDWMRQFTRPLLWGAGALVLLAAAVVALTWTRDAGEGESDSARQRRVAEATRLKPVSGAPPAATPTPSKEPEPPETAEPQNAAEPPAAEPTREPTAAEPEPSGVQPAPRAEVSFDAETAPTRFELSAAHRVMLDHVSPLPGAGGTLTGLKMMTRRAASNIYKLHGTSVRFDVPDSAWGKNEPLGHVPPLLFVPGAKPTLEVALKRTRWTQPDSRVLIVVGSSQESPTESLTVAVDGRPFSPKGSPVVVDPTDRFTVRDLSSRTTWTLTVAPLLSDAHKTVPPVLLVAQGAGVRLDGRPLPEGYGVVPPGKHKLTGAQSLWMSVPALERQDLATLEVSLQ